MPAARQTKNRTGRADGKKAKGKQVDTVLITDLFTEDGQYITDHIWVAQKKIKKYTLETGKIYTFKAKVGMYKRGRTASDFQLNALMTFCTLMPPVTGRTMTRMP